MDESLKFMDEDLTKIGLRIRAARTLTGLNQEEFAEKFNFGHTTIRHWESGYVLPRKSGLEKLCYDLSTLGVFIDVKWILYAEGSLRLKNSNNVVIEYYCKNCDPEGKNACLIRI
jgi:transcriptional regulator with XRE-family HTH domain